MGAPNTPRSKEAWPTSSHRRQLCLQVDGAQLTLAKMDASLDIHWLPAAQRRQAHHPGHHERPGWRKFRPFLVEELSQPCPSRPRRLALTWVWTTPAASTGRKTGNERFFTKDEKRLARCTGAMPKKRKGGKNREKARHNVARIHACIADRRRDFLESRHDLIHENQVVCVDRLSVENMLQNHCLAKAIAEVGWGEPVRSNSSTKRPGMAVRWLPSTSSIRARNGAMPAGISWTPWIWMFASGPVLRVARSMIGTRTLR